MAEVASDDQKQFKRDKNGFCVGMAVGLNSDVYLAKVVNDYKSKLNYIYNFRKSFDEHVIPMKLKFYLFVFDAIEYFCEGNYWKYYNHVLINYYLFVLTKFKIIVCPLTNQINCEEEYYSRLFTFQLISSLEMNFHNPTFIQNEHIRHSFHVIQEKMLLTLKYFQTQYKF